MSLLDNSSNCIALFQRNQKLLFKIPSSRLETVSPYPTNSVFQLDMRRKAEILQYSNSSSNSKTNNFTKKTNMSRILRGIKMSSSCDTISNPSYASGVPGKNINLFYDPKTPLYNYGTNINSYGRIPPVIDKDKWKVLTSENIILSNAKSSKLFSLYITQSIDQPYYIFSFTTPIFLILQR